MNAGVRAFERSTVQAFWRSGAPDPGTLRVTRPAPRLEGVLVVPGDKSISHRAVMLNAIASGVAMVTNPGLGADILSTAMCLRALGARVRRRGPDGQLTDDLIEDQESRGERQSRDPGGFLVNQEGGASAPLARDADVTLIIEGMGVGGLTEPADVLDAGNSGTTARLLSGILAAQPFFSVLTGDGSLRARPMRRVIEPLTLMGARISARHDGTLLPVAFAPGRLTGIEYQLPVASAQLKSCLLLAGLHAAGTTTIYQPAVSRDHTERMLAAQEVHVIVDGLRMGLEGGQQPRAVDVDVPGDLSSAAFWLVAGLIHPAARVTVRNVGVNPTRTGLLDVLAAMGARITRHNERTASGEPVADLTAESSNLRGGVVGGELIPRLIDEIPVLAVAAVAAEGTTEIRDAAELRVKESDRLAAVARELGRLGARVEELPEGLVIRGGRRLVGGECESHGDHRIAMALAVAGLASVGPVIVQDAGCAEISYPGFWSDLERLAPGCVRAA